MNNSELVPLTIKYSSYKDELILRSLNGSIKLFTKYSIGMGYRVEDVTFELSPAQILQIHSHDPEATNIQVDTRQAVDNAIINPYLMSCGIQITATTKSLLINKQIADLIIHEIKSPNSSGERTVARNERLVKRGAEIYLAIKKSGGTPSYKLIQSEIENEEKDKSDVKMPILRKLITKKSIGTMLIKMKK